MKDEQIKTMTQQQSAVMEQQAENLNTNTRDAAVEQAGAEQQKAVQQCAGIVSGELDRQADRTLQALEEAGASPDLSQAAQQLRQQNQEDVSSAADRANQLIANCLSENSPDESTRFQKDLLKTIDAVSEQAQQYAVAVDERNIQLNADLARAIEDGANEDTIRGIFEDAQKDFDAMRQEMDDNVQRLTREFDGNLAREVEKDGREIRDKDIRSQATDLAQKDLIEQMDSGIHRPEFEKLADRIGLDTLMQVVDELKSRQERGKDQKPDEDALNYQKAGLETHHETSLQEAPEWATKLENLAVVDKDTHRWEKHGNDFAEKRFGQPADARFDEHVPFQMEQGELDPSEDMDTMVSNAGDYEAHEAEDRMLEQLDEARHMRQFEEDRSREQQREVEREQQRLDQERDAQKQEDERRAKERAAQQQEDERRARERAAQQQEDERRARERAAQQQAKERMDRERREQEAADQRRRDEERNR